MVVMMVRNMVLVFLLGLSNVSYAGEPVSAASPDQINLALRRTADRLLRMAGDSTSRIPAIQQMKPNLWRIEMPESFHYENLPGQLQASLDAYNINLSYEVTIRTCEEDIIDLGFHQRDFLHDSIVPCGGRKSPEGCHYVEILFADAGAEKLLSVSNSLLVSILLLTGAGFWWWAKRKSNAESSPAIKTAEEAILFGQSKLFVANQMLECNGTQLQLTYRETKLLRLFAEHLDQLLERSFILEHVWADEGVQVGRSVDMFVSRLRKKISHDPGLRLSAVHGVGYKLEANANPIVT